MLLTRHATGSGPRWARDGKFLSAGFRLGQLLELSPLFVVPFLDSVQTTEPASGPLLAPVEDDQEVWASGVTYQRSRQARAAESQVKDVYDKVYEAERPELFFKSVGKRAVGPGMPIRVRADSSWNVPEPELTIVLNHEMEVVGYCVGNDVSSRSIEGENPLYLPQAKVYDGSCAIGPGIELTTARALASAPIRMRIFREGQVVFEDSTSCSRMRRSLPELASYLGKELSFPQGALLMTGTGIVPEDDFDLRSKDEVEICVADQTLVNPVL